MNMGAIMREIGYSESTSTQPTKITRTKTYQKYMKPLVDGLHEDIKRLQKSISETPLEHEDLRSKTYAYDILVKNYQLLSGGATERAVFVLPSEVMNKNEIQASESKTVAQPSLPAV